MIQLSVQDFKALHDRIRELEDAVSDLWAEIDLPEIDHLQPNTIGVCQGLHERRAHGQMK